MSTRIGPTSMPAISPPWTAAPMATARSGSISLWTGRPSRSSSSWWTSGVRVAPPTRTTLSIWLACTLPSVEGLVQAGQRLQEQGTDQLLVLVAGDLHLEVQRPAVLLGDELLLDGGHRVGREPLLGVLGGAEHPGLGGRRLPAGRPRAPRRTRRRCSRGATGRSRRRRAGCRRGWPGSRRRRSRPGPPRRRTCRRPGRRPAAAPSRSGAGRRSARRRSAR